MQPPASVFIESVSSPPDAGPTYTWGQAKGPLHSTTQEGVRVTSPILRRLISTDGLIDSNNIASEGHHIVVAPQGTRVYSCSRTKSPAPVRMREGESTSDRPGSFWVATQFYITNKPVEAGGEPMIGVCSNPQAAPEAMSYVVSLARIPSQRDARIFLCLFALPAPSAEVVWPSNSYPSTLIASITPYSSHHVVRTRFAGLGEPI